MRFTNHTQLARSCSSFAYCNFHSRLSQSYLYLYLHIEWVSDEWWVSMGARRPIFLYAPAARVPSFLPLSSYSLSFSTLCWWVLEIRQRLKWIAVTIRFSEDSNFPSVGWIEEISIQQSCQRLMYWRFSSVGTIDTLETY